MKNRSAVLLNTTTNLITHLRRDAHITPLTGIGAQFDDRYSTTFGKNTVIAGTEVSVDILRADFSRLSLLLGLDLKSGDGGLYSRGLLHHVGFQCFNLDLRLRETFLLLFELHKQLNPFLFEFPIGLFH